MPLLKPDLRTALERGFGGEMEAFEHALAQAPPVSVRLNPQKPCDLSGDRVPWSVNGRYLPERPVFTLDPRMHAGAYYVQEASSMILEPAFHATGLAGKDVVALDLCAAPGGKSTHLRSMLSDGSLLVCNEVEPKRASVLQENLWKWGHPNVVVCNSHPGNFTALSAAFDLILVDAPCSGEGLIRKDPFAIEQWSPALVGECALRQERILDAIWPALRPGGFLIYSTCTYEACENEEQVERVMAMHGAVHVAIEVVGNHGIRQGKNGIGMRCYPHLVSGEGQFMAVLRKPGERNDPPKARTSTATIHFDHTLRALLNDPEQLDFRQHRDLVFAASSMHGPFIDRLQQAVNSIAPGIPVADVKGKQLKPLPALALSSLLNKGAARTLPVEREDALRYLRGEALRAMEAVGTVLVTFNELALGWAKGAGNRWNNHWPDPWRIRMR